MDRGDPMALLRILPLGATTRLEKTRREWQRVDPHGRDDTVTVLIVGG